LLFGEHPRNRFKGAALKCTAKLGNYEFKPESFDQALVLVPELVEDWLRLVLSKEKDTSSFKLAEKESFPLSVLREAIMNALIHRDYSIEGSRTSIQIDDNSIIINSPGTPPSTISIEQLNTFKAPSFSTNPVISMVFNKMGYVEETGLGMATFKSLHEKFGLPLPEYTYEEPLLTLTFPKTMAAVKKISNIPNVSKLNDAQLQGYEWLKSVQEASTREYSTHFEIGYKTAQRHLAVMKELGLIRDNGVMANSPTLKYVVNE